MKKFKKILAIVLSMVMVLGMGVTAFASSAGEDGKVGTSDDKGKIIIENVDPTVREIDVYRIIKAEYDVNGVFSGYKAVERYEDILKGEYNSFKDALNAGFTLDANQINALGALKNEEDKIKTALSSDSNVDKDAIVFSYTPTQDADPQNNIKELGRFKSTDSFSIGMYLIVLKGAENTIYNYAVASIFYSGSEDTGGNIGNIIEDGKLDIISDATVFAKANDNPTVDKVIIDDDGATKGNSVNIGDTVKYKVTIDPIPYYGGEYPKLSVVDNLSTGLTLDQESIEVKIVSADGNKSDIDTKFYVLDKSANELTVNFVVNGKYTLNEYEGEKVEITYSAKLNDNAAINQNENNNDVTLTYSKDSKVESEDGTTEKKTYTYTFDIDGLVEGSITKNIINKTEEYEENGSVTKLNGAEFTLYVHEQNNDGYDLFVTKDENVIYKDTDGTWYKEDGSEALDVEESELVPKLKMYTNDAFGGTVTSQGGTEENPEGQLPIKGLAEGTYYLKETKAPAGYSLNTHPYKIEITATYWKAEDTDKPEDVEPGQLKNWTITIDGKTTNTFNVDYEKKTVEINNGQEDGVNGVNIPNTKMSSLPSTGGIGTTIFTIGGCAIMIIAAGLFFISRRKSAK